MNTPQTNRSSFAGRTPIFQALRRALAMASLSNQPGAPPADELPELRRANSVSRRSFLSTAALGSLIVGSGSLWSLAADRRSGASARVVIAGGGMAGLNTAYKLRKQGIIASIYDANSRSGGRMLTGTDIMGPGLTTELGGEFIDSTHKEMLSLASQFKMRLFDVQGSSEKKLVPEAYYFEGSHHTEEQLVEAFKPLVARIKADADGLAESIDYQHEGGGRELDNTSLAQYLDKIGATGWVRKLLETAYVTEYGLEAGEQSSLNFLKMISTDIKKGVALLGESDERYKVMGGNMRVVDELANRLPGQINLEHRLVRVESRDSGFLLTFIKSGGGTIEVVADIAVLALPFTLLREVELKVELPGVKKRAIAELSYGQNAKVMMGFNQRLWRNLGYGGNIYSDEPFQLAWDNSRLQSGALGGLTAYSGGNAALAVGQGTPAEQSDRLLPGLEKSFPGLKAAHNDRVARFHWPTYKWTKGSYAAYKVGQWTSIAGAEGEAVGNLLFAGEHCSADFQGFMNGAAESGKETAEAIVGLLKKPRRKGA